MFGGKRYDNAAQNVVNKREFLRPDLLPADKDMFSFSDVPDTLFLITNPAPWTKLYRRGFLMSAGLRFQALPNSNDFFFVLSSLAVAKKICAVDDDLIFYRINNCASTQMIKAMKPLCFFKAIYAVYDFLCNRDLYESLKQSFIQRVLSTTEFNLRTVNADSARSQILNELWSSRFQKMDILRPTEPDFYCTKPAYDYATRIDAAMRQYKVTLAAQTEVEFFTDIPCRAGGDKAVSVIIPVYNTGSYLHQTLECITGQTLKNIEIICVDDGSTDDSYLILKKWSERDDRIAIIRETNSGQSHARNVALQAAQGEYIYCMDSDDLLDTDALEILYRNAKDEDLDIVYFDADTFFESESLAQSFVAFSNSYSRKFDYSGTCEGWEMFTKFQTNREWTPSPCLQFIRRRVITDNKIRFRVGTIHEDNAFAFSVAMYAGKVAHVARKLFHRRIREKSTMTTQVSFKNSYGYFCGFLDMNRTFCEVEDKLDAAAYSAASERLCTILRSAQNCYRQMNVLDKGSELGLGNDYRFFVSLVVQPAAGLTGLDKLKQTYAEKSEINAKLKQTYAEKSEINAKLKQAYAEKSEINAKLKQTYAEKSEINAKLKQAYADKSERGIRIKELDAKLKQTYAEKSEINAKLKQTYAEKSEINAKLKQTYAEKSEINAKLKQAYAEKAERGIQIKELDTSLNKITTERDALNGELQNANKQLEEKNVRIAELERTLEEYKNSFSYRTGRILTYIPRKCVRLIRRNT